MMAIHDPFPSFPENARIWVYAAAEPIAEQVAQSLLSDLKEFTRGWTSHGRPVTAQVELIDRRFLMVAGFVAGHTVSGCGIDASVRALDEAATQRGIAWASALDVFLRDDTSEVRRVSRSEFRSLARQGLVGADTIVMDPSLTSVEEIRQGRFEGPAGTNWHRRLLASAGRVAP